MKALCKLNQRGVTLTELLLSITIISVISMVLMNFLTTWYQQHAITSVRAQLLSDAQGALDTAGYSVLLSSAADQNNRIQDANAPSAPTNQFSWESSASTLVLASAVENTSGSIVFSDAANYTSQKNNQIYYVSGGVLYRRILAANVANNKLKTTCPPAKATASCPADRVIARNVQTFSVKYYNNSNQEVQPTNARSIELSLTLSKRALSKDISSSYKTRMVFRNR